MNKEMKIQLKQCFELMAKIKDEYPEGAFCREMIHGDMNYRYRHIGETRKKLQALPVVIYDFARFKNGLKAPDEAVKRFFQSLIDEPERYSGLVGLKFPERRERFVVWSANLNIPPGSIDELLTRCRLSGILDAGYRLNEKYRDILGTYLSL
jgi:hypothetical protein